MLLNNVIDENVQLQLMRLGASIEVKRKGYELQRVGDEITIPPVLYTIATAIQQIPIKYYYDPHGKCFDFVDILVPVLPGDCVDYLCMEKHPYFSIFRNQFASYFLLRADDPNPLNPLVYFIDDDDFDEDDATLVSSLSDFLSELKTRDEVGQ